MKIRYLWVGVLADRPKKGWMLLYSDISRWTAEKIQKSYAFHTGFKAVPTGPPTPWDYEPIWELGITKEVPGTFNPLSIE